MPTQDILQFFRKEEPRFEDVSDADLVNFIGGTQKEFLQDEDFKSVYKDTLRSRITVEEDPGPSTPEIAVKSGLRGIVDVAASVPKAVAFGATAINKLRGDDTPPEELTTFQLGELIKEMGEEAFPLDEQARDTWTAKISQGLGSAAGFMAGGGAASAVGRGFAGIAGLGSAATADEFYTDAKQSGASEDTAFKAAALGAGVGLTELVPLNKILNRATGGTSSGIKKALLDAALEGGEEAVQELTQNTLQNVTAQQLGYDPDRGVWEGGLESATVGGTTGVILSGIASALGARRIRVSDTSQESEPAVSETVEPIGEVPTATESVEEGVSNVADIEARPEESFPVDPATDPVVVPEEVITPEQKELASQSIALEQELAEASAEFDSVSQQAGALESMLQEGDPETLKTMAADMKLEEEVLKSRVADLKTKRAAAIEARKTISEAQLKAVEPELTQTADLTLEEDIKPETESIVSMGAVEGPMTPLFGRTKDSLTFDPTELVKTWPGKVIEYSRRGLVGHSAPTEFSEKALTSQAKKSSFVKLSKGYAEELDRLIKADAKKNKPRATRLLAASNAFLAGKKVQEGILTPGMMEVLTNARKLIDTLSQRVLDLGLVEGALAKTIKDNIGSYLTRTYKVYDKIYDWTYDTVPKAIIDKASKYIQETQKVDAKKADEIIRDILDPRVATEWLLGKTKVGGIPVSSFLKRNDIPVEIRQLMGEIKNPLENLMKTTNTLASIVTAFELQEQIANMGLKGGVFVTEPTGDMRHLVFGGRTGVDPQLAKKYPSLANLYATKEMSEAMQRFYGSNVGPESMLDLFVWKPLRKITSFGKFNQVILNLTDAFPVNLTGAVMVELMNGRIIRRPGLAIRSLFGLATRRFRRDRGEGKPPKISKIEDALKLTGADFKKGWNSFIKDLDLVEALAQRFGAVEDNVIVRDILEGWASGDQLEGLRKLNKRSIKRLPAWLKNKVFSPLGNIYAYPDNAMKVNAFMDEALTYANAYPERSMSDIFKTAADITRATTPVYSKVPKGLRELNLVGVIPTYISFTYEMFRNTFNTVSIGMQEMKSSNPLIKARGANRTVSSMGILGLAAFAAQGIADFFREMFTDSDELGEERRKDLNWLLAPWDRFQQNGILNYKHGKEFTYSNLSYQIPQAVVTAPVTAALESKDPDEAFKNFAATTFNTFFGGSIVAGSIGSVIYNKKAGGGEIYNEQLDFVDWIKPSMKYVSKNVFMPGFARKWERMQKASEDSGGSYGRLYSTTEETIRLFGIRPNTYNIPEASRFRMADFSRDYQVASRIISDIRAKRLPAEEAADLTRKEKEAQDRIKDDYVRFTEAMLRLGVPKATLRKNQKDIFKAELGERRSSVPKDLRAATAHLLR